MAIIRNARIALARRNWRKAATAVGMYDNARNRQWNVAISVALHRAECAAANRLARLIDPAAILRAF